MKPTAFLLAAILAAASTQGITMAAEVSTDPVGVNSVTALGNSDTRFSIPLQRPLVFQGAVQSVADAVVTVQGSPTWASNEFVYVAGTQSNAYYLTFTTGTRAGMYYTVTSNAAAVGANTATLTLDLNGDDLGAVGGVVAGDKFKIIPYWTLNTLFPNQVGITKSSLITGTGALTRILFYDANNTGINLASSGTYFYYEGQSFGGSGWRRINGGFTAIKNDEIILPDAYVVLRQEQVATSLVATAVGVVPAGERRYLIGTLLPNVTQDNLLALDLPIPLSLSQSKLWESGAFTGASVISGSDGDKLLIYDDTVVGKNKGASKSYFYFTGSTNGGPGWRQVNGGFSAIKNDEVVFKPGSGFVIRKLAASTPSTVVWTIPAAY